MVHICSYFCRERIADCISKVSHVKTIQFILFWFKIINFFSPPPWDFVAPSQGGGENLSPPPLRGGWKCSGGVQKKNCARFARAWKQHIFSFRPPLGKSGPPLRVGEKIACASRAQKLVILDFRTPLGKFLCTRLVTTSNLYYTHSTAPCYL